MGNLAPLAGPKVAEAVRQAISELYAVWARALSGGFSKYTTPDGSLPPRLGEPQWNWFLRGFLLHWGGDWSRRAAVRAGTPLFLYVFLVASTASQECNMVYYQAPGAWECCRVMASARHKDA